jgi:hypothetical protein
MISAIYELIGRIVVRLAWLRFGSQIKIAGGALAVLAIAGGYLLARRQPPEG